MKNFKKPAIKATIVLLIVIAIGVGFLISNFNKKNVPNTSSKPSLDGIFSVKGILREIYFMPDDTSKMLLEKGNYVLAQVNKLDKQKLPYNAEVLYIEKYPKDMANFIGKCVEIKGKLDTKWLDDTGISQTGNSNPFFNGIVILADEVNKLNDTVCDGYKQADLPKDTPTTVVSGKLQRMGRLNPKTGPFDYNLLVESTSSEDEAPDALPIVPSNNQIWLMLEKMINKDIAVEGYMIKLEDMPKNMIITRVRDPKTDQ